MFFYSKRVKYVSKCLTGRNNRGVITVRGRQKFYFSTTQLKNINYNYIFFESLFAKNVIRLKIVKKIFNPRMQRYVYLVLILDNLLKNCYKHLPITSKTKIGDIIFIGTKISPFKYGNIVPIRLIPYGTWVHNIESIPMGGSTFVRGSKISAFLLSIGKKYVIIKLPSRRS